MSRESLQAPQAEPSASSGSSELSTNRGYRAALSIAWVSGLAVVIGCALMLENYIGRQQYNPLEAPEFVELKAQLAKSPGDEALKARIRELDLQLRRDHFRRLAFSGRGVWFLLASVLVFVLSMKWVFACRRSLPVPPPDPDEETITRRMRLSMASVAGLGCAVLLGAFVLAALEEDGWSRAALEAARKVAGAQPGPFPDGTAGPEPELAKIPSPEDFARNWGRFRGPGGRGVSADPDVAVAFDIAAGKGIVWKAAVPLASKSSPVLWDDRIFLTGATEKQQEVYCFDAASGKLVWKEPVATARRGAEPPEVLESTGFAASTPVTDGAHVCAVFATGDIGCFDARGKKLWARALGPLENVYGHGTSLVMYRNLVLVLLDQASEDDGKSRLLALDITSGKTSWKVEKRPVAASWATPIIVSAAGRDQLITSANPWVIAYDPLKGEEVWKAECMAGDVAPSPVPAGDMVLAVNVDAELTAIRLDGKGDVTESHIAWTAEDGLPDICSPVSDGKRVFLLTTFGNVTCYDARTGELAWDHKIKKMAFDSSPSIAGSRLLLWSRKGVLLVLDAGKEYKELGRYELGEAVHASPAFAKGRMYIRGAKNLYCIGSR